MKEKACQRYSEFRVPSSACLPRRWVSSRAALASVARRRQGLRVVRPILCSAALIAAQLVCASFAAAQPNPLWIRVAVARDHPQVTLQIFGGFTMFALHTGDPIRQQPRLHAVPVRGVPQGLALGEEIVPYPGVRIEPNKDAAISLNGKRLRGTLEIVRQKDFTLLVVNHVALEDYLRGVLSKEAPDYWPDEALKAIAIAARTYALYQRLTKETSDFDVTSDVMSQDYGGRASEKVATTRAVRQTAGLVLLYQGKIFPTFYHSTCGGITEHARVMGPFDLAPIRGGIRCTFCTASPFYAWQRRLTHTDVAWALRKSRYGSVGAVRGLQVTKRTESGRVDEIAILGAQRVVRMSGYDFRSLFGLDSIRSPLFSVVPQADGFVIQGHGWGHGVGLCQWGAAELARRGLTAREILAYYYPSTEMAQLRELARSPAT